MSYEPNLRGDATLITHGRCGQLTGAALLLDAVLGGQLDVIEGRRVVAGRELAGPPLLAELRERVLAAPPGSPRDWIGHAAEFAPHRVAVELITAGVASPLERRFQRGLTLSVDARAEVAARRRIADDPALAGLLYLSGVPTGDPLPPALHTLPGAARAVLQALRSDADRVAARIAG